jgi:UDP-N-acetylmuramoylalanine--D-glutamate ligase
MVCNKLKNKLNVVVGLGKTGLSCVSFCLRQGWPVAVTDSRENPPCAAELKKLAPHVETAFGQISKDLIDKASQLIISPGVSLKEAVIFAAIQRGISYVGDIELFAQNVSAPIIAITGSNAKSTVTTLVGEMAKQAGIKVEVAGNIGLPVLDLLEKSKAELYVLELSSFQLETTHSLKAKVAVVLNISEDHMDRYESMEEYVAAKRKVYDGCESAVIYMKHRGWDIGCEDRVLFGLERPLADQYGVIEDDNETYLAYGDERLLNVKELKLFGRHNVENALAALAIGKAASIDKESMLKALREFPGLSHRCQFIRKLNGISWYNDSKGTNVGATIAALEGFGADIDGKIVLIAGGVGKGADFIPLQKQVKKFVRKTILIGEAAKELSEVLSDCCEVELATSMQQAVQLAKVSAVLGDVVLLSPACASFDMFRDYQHRGDEFVKLVNRIE